MALGEEPHITEVSNTPLKYSIHQGDPSLKPRISRRDSKKARLELTPGAKALTLALAIPRKLGRPPIPSAPAFDGDARPRKSPRAMITAHQAAFSLFV